MKTIWFTTLTLLCAVGFAQADGMPSNTADTSSDTASAEMASQEMHKTPVRKAKRLPRGDLRYCLELKTNEEIIRCSETRRKR